MRDIWPLSLSALSLSSDTSTIALGYDSGLVVIYDFDSRNPSKEKPIQILPPPEGAILRVNEVAWSGQDKLAVCYSDAVIQIVGLKRGYRALNTHRFDNPIVSIGWVTFREVLVLTALRELWVVPDAQSRTVKYLGSFPGTSVLLCDPKTRQVGILLGTTFRRYRYVDESLEATFEISDCASVDLSPAKGQFCLLLGQRGLCTLNCEGNRISQVSPKIARKHYARVQYIDAVSAFLVFSRRAHPEIVSARSNIYKRRLLGALGANWWASNAASLVTVKVDSRSNRQELTVFRPDLTVLQTSVLHLGGERMQPSTIMHISDLHFSSKGDSATAARRLIERVRLDGIRVDYLVISGDIADRGSTQGYKEGVAFVRKLTRALGISQAEYRTRIVIVPGNHDVDYSQSSDSFRYVGRQSRAFRTDLDHISIAPHGQLQKITAEYERRFERFSKLFFVKVFGKAYPKKESDQWVCCNGSNDQLLIVGLNSACKIDHISQVPGHLDPVAIERAMEKANLFVARHTKAAIVVVVHHPIGQGQRDIPAKEGHGLSTPKVACILHGDSHLPTSDPRGPATSSLKARIGAGYCGASATGLPAGAKWSFHYVQLDWEKRQVTVTSRMRENESGEWQLARIYGKDDEGKDSYDFSF